MARQKTYYHVTETRNLDTILAQGLKPRIGERSFLAGETRQAVYLFGDLDSVENALDNWMSECFEEQDCLALLKINLPVGVRAHRQTGSWELRVFNMIPPDSIQVMSDDLDNFTEFDAY
jgi:hypothetical protein